MKSAVLANWNLPYLSIFALFIFIGVFFGVLALLFIFKNKQDLIDASHLPLQSDDEKLENSHER